MDHEDLDCPDNIFKRVSEHTVNYFARFGLYAVKILAVAALGTVKGLKLVFSELLGFLSFVFKGIRWFWHGMTESIRLRTKRNKELYNNVRKSKKRGKAAHAGAVTRFAGSFLFGEDGILYTVFNYTMPIISVAFFVGIIRYGSSLEYGIAVDFNGKEIGIINAEADFEKAEREVQQRIAYNENDKTIDLSANFSLKIISDNDKLMSSDQLANKMLEASDEKLTEAWGIYIDGKFIAAVEDKDQIQKALSDRLLNYHVDGEVHDLSYKNKIEYTQGIYLQDSVMEEKPAIEMLTSSTEKKGVYIAQTGDTTVSVCQKYNMSLDDFKKLNPYNSDMTLKGGQVINILETESYLPIQYVKEFETLSFLDYETVEYETTSLNVGVKTILVKGMPGEKVSNTEITYVDGIERSRKTVKSVVTKEPVIEQIGIGTYSARPDPNCRPVTGSGEMGWPIDGGWISDTFISDRDHKGLDIAANEGTDIYAAADGVVISAGWNSGGYGYMVQIDHLNGYQTIYGHMSAVFATENQTVTRGQLIGAVGNTGNSNGAHCHFEVRYMGVCYDPELFLNTVDGTNEEDPDG